MLGKALITHLIAEGNEVTIIVRRNSKKLQGIPAHDLINIVECDLSEYETLGDQLDFDYDTFFHLAWDGTYGAVRNDMFVQQQNIKYTLDAVELAKRLNCKVFIGAGSQAEYGNVGRVKLSSELKTNPESGYGIAKLCAGQMSRIKCNEYGIKHVWIRILSTYGPYDGSQTLIMSSIQNMLLGKKTSYTKCDQIWDYLYCNDAARALDLVSRYGKEGEIYCLGSGQAQPLYKYIESIRDIIDPNIELGFGELPYYQNQVMYLCADITKLTRDTGFKPEYTFQDGIKETIEWYKKR